MTHSALRTAISIIVLYAALLGGAHGFYEVQQGPLPPDGFAIQAIGAPCDPASVWHACFPAVTMMPSMFLAGVATLIVALLVIAWPLVAINGRHAGLALIGLGLLFALVGGGFIAPALTLLAGGLATRLRRGVPGLGGPLGARLARLWPWAPAAYAGWLILQTAFHIAFGAGRGLWSGVMLLIANGLLLTMITGALAHDAQASADRLDRRA